MLDREAAVVVLVDIQEKLLPAMQDPETVLANTVWTAASMMRLIGSACRPECCTKSM